MSCRACVVKVARWGEGDDDAGEGPEELKVSPSGRLVARREGGSGRVTLVRTEDGRRLGEVQQACESFCWLSSGRLACARVDPGDDDGGAFRLLLHKVKDDDDEDSGSQFTMGDGAAEPLAPSVDEGSGKRYFVGSGKGTGTYELVGCLDASQGAEGARPVRVARLACDCHEGTCVLAVENKDGSESLVALQSSRHFVESYPAPRLPPPGNTTALCATRDLVLACRSPGEVLAWAPVDPSVVWRHRLRPTPAAAASSLAVRTLPRGRLLIAVGDDRGVVTLLEPFGSFGSRQAPRGGRVETRDFRCRVRRVVLQPFWGCRLAALAFQRDRILALHFAGATARLAWAELRPQPRRREAERSRAEGCLTLERATVLGVAESSAVFLSGGDVVCVLPGPDAAGVGRQDPAFHLCERTLKGDGGALAVADDVHAWLTDFLATRPVHRVKNLVDLNGICRGGGDDDKVLLPLRAALHRFDVDLLGKLVPEIVSGGADLWVSCARLVSLEVAINLFKYPSLKETVLPKVLTFVIAILGRAHSSGDEATALELSRYLKMLRSFSRVRSPGGRAVEPGGGVEAEPEKVTEEGQQPGCGDKFEILRTGLAADRASEAMFRLLSSGLNNPASAAPMHGDVGGVKRTINSYIVRLVQEAPIDEIGHSLGRLGLSPTRTLLDVFWSALTPGIRSRALALLDALGGAGEDVQAAAGRILRVRGAYESSSAAATAPGPSSSPEALVRNLRCLDEGDRFGVETSPPHLDVHIDLEGTCKFEGVLGRAWPKRMIREDADDDGDGDGDGEGDEEDDGDGLDSIPALWFAEMEEESVRRIIVEGARLRGRPLPLGESYESWESCFRYACEHARIDMISEVLQRIPDGARCPGQLQVKISQRAVKEIPMAVFLPALPEGLPHFVLAEVRHRLAEQGIFQQLYWSSALDFLSFCERTVLSPRCLMPREDLEQAATSIKTVSAIYCRENGFANLSLLHDRSLGSADFAHDALENIADLSWCGWLPIAQHPGLQGLSCALNTAIVCHLDVRTTSCEGFGWVEGIEGIGNYLHSLPLLGYEPSEGERCPHIGQEFWVAFKEELMQNARLQHKYPTLACFLAEMCEQRAEGEGPSCARDESFVAVRNALFSCSSNSSLLLSNYPNQLPQWTKKLLHLSTSVRRRAGGGAQGGSSEGQGLAEAALRQEREIEKYVENEFFVLPYESSLCLKVQNNIMHGRSFASIDACLKSETTRHMEEAGASWAQIRANDDFTTLERTCYCSALSNFQDETVVSAGVLTLQVLGEDTYALQLVIAILRHLVLCLEGGLATEPFTTAAAGSSAHDGYDFLTPVVQVICEDVKKGLALGAQNAGASQLREMLADLLGGLLRAENRNEEEDDDVIEVDGSPTDARVATWVLLNALNEVFGHPRDESYVAYLARGNDWVRFLAECERHGYTLREVLGLAGHFGRKELRCHVERALLSTREAEDGALEDRPEDQKPLPELFALVSESERQPLPGKFLLESCVRWRWPFLAVLSSCHDDVTKTACFQHWLGSTCLPTSEGGFEPQQHSIPYLVTALCGRRCYLPLIRGGETFFPKSVFVTFLYFLHSFMQLRLLDAEAYLEKFKRMAESSAAGAADEDWMASSTVLALESSLASEASNSFLRNTALAALKRCNVLGHFPNLRKVSVLRDILGEDAHAEFVTWRRPQAGGGDTPLVSVDLEQATARLELENRFGEARILCERCGLDTEGVVLRHAERIAGDAKASRQQVEAAGSWPWGDIQALFEEAKVTARRAGDFFFAHFGAEVSRETAVDSLRVLELAHGWYLGAQEAGEPWCTPDLLSGVKFRGLICGHAAALGAPGGTAGAERWYMAGLGREGAAASGPFMLGSAEHEALVHYARASGSWDGMSDPLLGMLFDALVWYGEIDLVKALGGRLEGKVEGIRFLEALVKVLADHGDDQMSSSGPSLAGGCLSYLQDLLPSDCRVPSLVVDAVAFCRDRIPRDYGREFADRVAFSFEVSSISSSVTPNSVLRSNAEGTLQTLLRLGPDLLGRAREFVDVFRVPRAKVADVLVKSFFKGLLICHRDVSDEASSSSYEPAYNAEEFDKCAGVCGDDAELGRGEQLASAHLRTKRFFILIPSPLTRRTPPLPPQPC